mgnify:CR=1 FL=1
MSDLSLYNMLIQSVCYPIPYVRQSAMLRLIALLHVYRQYALRKRR